MKKILSLFAVLSVVLIISCSKSSVDPVDNTTDKEFKFVSLVSQDTALPINGITTVTASATGSGLTYRWTASYGSFIGSGASVKWTVCHSDTFTISCEVKDDQGHAESKVISINVR
ncbi:MAG: hypothetical protein ACOYN5_14505 [Bacteroidales bacterium]|jgi:hypothetical protein